MSTHKDSARTPGDHLPDSIATPEGDLEGDGPVPEGMQVPPGNGPNPVDRDKPAKKPSGLEKFIDEVERGEYM